MKSAASPRANTNFIRQTAIRPSMTTFLASAVDQSPEPVLAAVGFFQGQQIGRVVLDPFSFETSSARTLNLARYRAPWP